MGGSSPAPAPSTTTTVNDIPAWEQGYVTDLLGQSQAAAAVPYQQYPGQQVANLTPDQLQAFSNVEGATATNQANQATAQGQTQTGANTAGNILANGAPSIAASTAYNPLAAVSPFIGASAGYDAAATNTATPQGIQSFMSPYLNNQIQGLETTAQQNFNQFTAPQVNDAFTGSGQYNSGRNTQVMGQQANLANQALTGQIANAEQAAYTTAGNQAATQAGLLGNAGTATAALGSLAGTATNQQATNLQNAGTALGNLTSTQAGQQVTAGNALASQGAQAAQTNFNQNQALQAVGQQQQAQNQTNINAGISNFNAQVAYPEQQLTFLNNMIRGLPNTGGASTTASQATAGFTPSPLSAIGGASIAASGLNTNTASNTGLTHNARGGLIKGYAAGGNVDDEEAYYYGDDGDQQSPIAQSVSQPVPVDEQMSPAVASDDQAATPTQQSPIAQAVQAQKQVAPAPEQTPKASASPLVPNIPHQISDNDIQNAQLLAIGRALMSPTKTGSPWEAIGTGLGNAQDVTMKMKEMQANQGNKLYETQLSQAQLAKENAFKEQGLELEKEKVDQGNYIPYGKDPFTGVPLGLYDKKNAKMVTPTGTATGTQTTTGSDIPSTPSTNIQTAAQQILQEEGTPQTMAVSRPDQMDRNKQQTNYKTMANAAIQNIQQLDELNALTGKYKSGGGMGVIYGTENYIGLPSDAAAAKAEADKYSKMLSNSLMNANASSNGKGVNMVKFEEGAVPNSNMPDSTRTQLINANKAIANSQLQRALISDLLPHWHSDNMSVIADNYEAKNPPVFKENPNDPTTMKENPNWMPFKDWIKAGRPDNSLPKSSPSSALATPAGGSATGIHTEYTEGQTATNKATGEKWVYKSGSWRPQ